MSAGRWGRDGREGRQRARTGAARGSGHARGRDAASAHICLRLASGGVSLADLVEERRSSSSAGRARARRRAWRLLTCPFFCPAGCDVPGCLPGDRGHCPSRAGPGAGGADDAHDRRNQPLSISSASWVVRATWAKGYVVDVTVIVDCLDSSRKHRFGVDGFRVHFTLGDGALIAKTWNAKFVQKGAACEATHERFCAPVHSEQAVLYFGFEVRIDMAAASTPFIPAAITVNGQLCPVRACFARDLADCRNDDDESDDFPAPPRSATRKDKEPVGLEENQETVARTRCCSAPPVLYTESFGVASLPSQGEDAIAPLASASHSPKNSDEWHVDSWNDDGKSVAETVHERAPSRGGEATCGVRQSRPPSTSPSGTTTAEPWPISSPGVPWARSNGCSSTGTQSATQVCRLWLARSPRARCRGSRGSTSMAIRLA
ncbi:MAG: cellulose binding domain-containing protein, partial [Promethearchaeia archaeon]